MNARIRALQASKAEKVQAARGLITAAEVAGRDLTAEEQTQFDALMAEAASYDAKIAREQALALQEAGLSAAVGANNAAQPPPLAQRNVTQAAVAVVESVRDNTHDDPRRGFANFGDFAARVRGAAFGTRTGQAMDGRLIPLAAQPTTAANEGAGADGGFLVPPEFARNIFMLSLGEDALLPLTDEIPVEGNTMVFPKDETTPWGTNGIRAYWQAEASTAQQVKPVLSAMELRLKKLMALVPVTDELNADTSALNAYLPAKVALSIRWKTNDAILFGSGAGVPLGALNGSAAVVQAKDSGQATGTLTTSNLLNMMSRLPPDSFGTAIWMINNTVIPALGQLTLGNYPIFLPIMSPNGAISGAIKWTLLGRPVVVTQHAKAFSSQGDVLLLDMKYYQAITKAEGVRTDTSMHLYFDADAIAYRTTFRMDGQPKIVNPINPANGSTTLSPFVQLASR